MTANQNQILSEFKKTVVQFFDELIAQFPSASDLVVCRILMNDQVPVRLVMDAFCDKLDANEGEMRAMIREKNESFFIERDIFEVVSGDVGTRLKKLWVSPQLRDDDRNIIWDWFNSFVFLADKFKKSL